MRSYDTEYRCPVLSVHGEVQQPGTQRETWGKGEKDLKMGHILGGFLHGKKYKNTTKKMTVGSLYTEKFTIFLIL